MFCAKKPPKTEDSENLLTHHQRKLVDLAKHHLYANHDNCKYAVHISADDKAYIRPETSGNLMKMPENATAKPETQK